MLKFVPALAGPATAVQETAETLQTATGIEAEPLAYLAFARVELELNSAYRTRPESAPLAEVFDGK